MWCIFSDVQLSQVFSHYELCQDPQGTNLLKARIGSRVPPKLPLPPPPQAQLPHFGTTSARPQLCPHGVGDSLISGAAMNWDLSVRSSALPFPDKQTGEPLRRSCPDHHTLETLPKGVHQCLSSEGDPVPHRLLWPSSIFLMVSKTQQFHSQNLTSAQHKVHRLF